MVTNAAGIGLNLNGDTGSFAVTGTTTINGFGPGINLANNTGGSVAFSGPSQKLNTGANTALTLS